MKSSSLLAAGSLLAVLVPATARAEEFALNFDPPEIALHHDSGAEQSTPQLQSPPLSRADLGLPLPVPARAASPPLRYHSPAQLPPGVYRQAVAVALGAEVSPASLLPSAPPAPAPTPTQPGGSEGLLPAVATSTPPPPAAQPSIVSDATPKTSPTISPPTLALTFELASPTLAAASSMAGSSTPPVANRADVLGDLFSGNSDSLVARAVGSAEGTRTPSGDRTAAYYGHVDPGNGVWNLGTFSYQHGAPSATAADAKQLRRLKTQTEILQTRATQLGLSLSLEETLNGIDLANQSPLAAIGRVGYVERLAEAKARGHSGMDAIVVARTRAYLNPKTQRWNAPGLGNTQASISRDQKRRARAVSHALVAFEQENPSHTSLGSDVNPPDPAEGSLPISPEPRPDPQPLALGFNLEPANLPAPVKVAVQALTPGLSQAIRSIPSGTDHQGDRPAAAIAEATISKAPLVPSTATMQKPAQAASSPLTPPGTPAAITPTQGAETSAPSPKFPQKPLTSLTWLSSEPGAMPQAVVHPPSAEPQTTVVKAPNPPAKTKADGENQARPDPVDEEVSQVP